MPLFPAHLRLQIFSYPNYIKETKIMRQIDVHKLSDEAKFNGFHGKVLLWCGLIIIFDGYDLAVAGISCISPVAPLGLRIGRPSIVARPALSACITRAIQAGGTPQRAAAASICADQRQTPAGGSATASAAASATRLSATISASPARPDRAPR